MTLVHPSPDLDLAAEFLHVLYADVDDGWITLFSARDGRTKVDWYTVDHLDDAAARAVARSNQDADVWFGVATRHERLTSGRGGADDCHQIAGLWLDLDVAGPRHRNTDGLPPTLEDAYRILDRFPYPPSFVINSGGGLQPWWFLSEPVDVDPELLRRWHQTWARIAAETGGWRIDNVSDPARVMRVPGTLNRKLPDDPALVTVAAGGGTRYALTDLAELLDDTPPPPVSSPGLTKFDADDLRPGDEFNATHTGNDVLAAAGWHHHRDLPGGDTAWRRPGKPDPRTIHSAIVYNDGHICCYSDALSDTRLEQHRSYDPWGAHVTINHGGDWTAAAKAWRADHPSTTPPREDWTAFDDLLDPHTDAELNVPAAVDEANMAAAFADHIAGRYLYCAQLGGWFAWDTRRWRRDHDEAVYETCRRWVLALGQQMFLRSDVDNDQVRKVASYRSASKINNVITLTRRIDGIVAAAAEFDQHPDLLCARNGVIDLHTGELQPHDPALRLTRLTDTDYRPEAVHNDVQAVLETVETDVRAWLQTMFGYAATGHVSEDLMPVFDGTGSNGKTTLLAAVSAALGEHAKAAPDKLLMQSGHDEHPTLIADLFGRRLVYIEETAEGGALRVEKMKALTGGSELSARYMRQDYFTFTPTHQLVVATNHRPAVNSTEYATWRRLRLVPFPHRYTAPENARPGDRVVDRGLRHRLTAGQGQREATLAWIVAGAVRWHRDGLGDCPTVTAATREWQRSEDVILRFIEDRCELGTGLSARSQELHREYAAWCEVEGRPSSSNKEFTKRMEAHDVAAQLEFRKTRNGAVWFGLGVRDAF